MVRCSLFVVRGSGIRVSGAGGAEFELMELAGASKFCLCGDFRFARAGEGGIII